MDASLWIKIRRLKCPKVETSDPLLEIPFVQILCICIYIYNMNLYVIYTYTHPVCKWFWSLLKPNIQIFWAITTSKSNLIGVTWERNLKPKLKLKDTKSRWFWRIIPKWTGISGWERWHHATCVSCTERHNLLLRVRIGRASTKLQKHLTFWPSMQLACFLPTLAVSWNKGRPQSCQTSLGKNN